MTLPARQKSFILPQMTAQTGKAKLADCGPQMGQKQQTRVETMPSSNHQVLIVGGGTAGITVAAILKRRAPGANIAIAVCAGLATRSAASSSPCLAVRRPRGSLPVSGFFSRASREVTKSLRSPTRLRGFNICRRARTNRAGACWRR